MKNITIAIFIVLIVVVLGLYLVLFQVRETESALVMTFGEPTRQITKPGCYFKWPDPIQKVHKFDSRMRVLEGNLVETTTRGAVTIIVKNYVVWKITEPLKFFNANKRRTIRETIREAETKLLSRISNTQNEVIGRHFFSEFVNSDRSKVKLEEIEREMQGDLKETVRADYGIEIKTLGVKQLKVSEDVTDKVFDRMIAERERKTLATIAEGNARAIGIKSDADEKKTVLLAAAEARAMAIRGKGDAEAAKYYKMLKADPELAMFLRNIKALKKYLEKNATIVFSADTDPLNLLKEIPDIKPADSKEPRETTLSGRRSR